MKMANGVVLDKPGKPSYDSPSSFSIIVLLQTISKILERIVASRLSAIARYVGLLHRNQCGSLPSLSLFDACTALTDTVRTLQRPALKVSSLFLDIKGGFDNVDADILCSSLRSKGVNHYLISWVRSFLTGRSCRLLFQGSPRIFSPVSVGTPQGSSVSSLLFVIYVAPLHIPLSRGLVLSYVDDLSLTVSSPLYRTNSRSLQAAFGRIRAIAHSRKVDISVPKTELINWRTPLQWDPPGTPRPPLVALDGQIFHHSEKLRWLGYWFVPNLAFSTHFSRRLALSHAAFSSVRPFPMLAKASHPTYATVSPTACCFPFFYMVLTCSHPPKGSITSSRSIGGKCRDGSPTVSDPLPCRFSLRNRAFHHSRSFSRIKDGWLLLGSSPRRRLSTPPQPAFADSSQLYSRPWHRSLTGPCVDAWILMSATQLKDSTPLPSGAYPSPGGCTSASYPSPP